MKKLLNVLLILAVMFANLVPTSVFAAKGKRPETGSITIVKDKETAGELVEGTEYKIYRLFDIISYSYETEFHKDGKASYKVSSKWLSFFEGEGAKYIETIVAPDLNETTSALDDAYITIKKGVNAKELAEAALAYAEKNNIAEDTKSVVTSTDVTNGFVKVEGLELGYYLVDSSLGTVCSLDATTKDVTIYEKNSTSIIPEKKVNGLEATDANIGEVVNYEVTIDEVANKQAVVCSDTLSNGLTLDTNSIVVKLNDNTLSVNVDYTFTVLNSNNYEFTVNDAKLHNIDADSQIVITYNAEVNSNAIVADEGNENVFKVTYGNNPKNDATDSAVVYTYGFNIRKVDESASTLTGAIFELYTKENGGDKITFVKGDTTYSVASSTSENTTTSIIVDENGMIYLEGLANGTYYLEETVAPEGYNKLGKRIPVTINFNNDGEITTIDFQTVDVINTTGAILPSTGGMGTVLFITVGSIMALGFGVNLVTKARMRKIED